MYLMQGDVTDERHALSAGTLELEWRKHQTGSLCALSAKCIKRLVDHKSEVLI